MTEEQHQRTWTTWIGIACVLLVVALAVFGSLNERFRREAEQLGKWKPLETRLPVPSGTTVPTKGTTDLPASVARPTMVFPSNPAQSADLRGFEIHAYDNKFSPDTIIVHVNDVAQITIVAEDHDYDFIQPDYGIKETIRWGETKQISFSPAGEGKFLFYCAMCSEAPADRPRGSIIVVKR